MFDQKLCVISKSVFDIYNTFLQSEESFVHLIKESILNFQKTLLACFIKPHITAQSDDILSTDIKDSTNYKEGLSVHFRYFTKQRALSKDLVETSKYTEFLKEVHEFCVKNCSYLLKSTLVLRDPTLKWLSVFLNTAKELTLEKII